MEVIGRTTDTGALGEGDIESVVSTGLGRLGLDGKRILVIVPDGTRTMSLPLFFRLITKHLLGRVRQLDFLVALGTHPVPPDSAILRLFGVTPEEKAGPYAAVGLLTHRWDDPRALAGIGTLRSREIAALSDGRLRMDVPVRVNRLALEYDHLLVCGPVFPHEVAGFSGGDKYFFPGIAGADVIDFTHWLGALITTHDVIGRLDTPIRRVIARAAALIPTPRSAICAVVTHDGVVGVYAGGMAEAWEAAARLSSERHVIWLQRPVRQVLSVLPEMYDELWVGSKGMYKTEPVVVDGGEVILFAPHLREVSVTHGAILRQIGYHVRDYYVARWSQFRHLPWGVLAHSTQLKGSGHYTNGVESPRIKVTLATGISEQECSHLNLGYRDPATIDPGDFAGREADGVLCVPRAGEYLYRLRDEAHG